MILYVDDITILGDNLKNVGKLRESMLSNRYEMSDLGRDLTPTLEYRSSATDPRSKSR